MYTYKHIHGVCMYVRKQQMTKTDRDRGEWERQKHGVMFKKKKKGGVITVVKVCSFIEQIWPGLFHTVGISCGRDQSLAQRHGSHRAQAAVDSSDTHGGIYTCTHTRTQTPPPPAPHIFEWTHSEIRKARGWQLLLCADEPVGKSFWGTRGKSVHLSSELRKPLKESPRRLRTQIHTLSTQRLWQSAFRLYKYERDMYHMSGTLMRLAHVPWTSSYEWYRRHVELECSLMMDRSNIE